MTTALTWNALNQPVTVNSTSATYDALGRMVEKGLSGVYTQFVYRPSGGMLAVYSGTLSKGTISLPGGSTAVYNAVGLNFIRHKDWLGSSRLATTWQHGVYSKEAYAPFGETYNEAGTADRSFTGQDQNVATGSGGNGAYDFLFRKYDPSAGRWMSPDPAGWAVVNQMYPQSLNRYAYVQNNPLSATDQQGLDCVYLNDSGTSVESVDHNSSNGECDQSGGYWANGYVPDGGSTVYIPSDGGPLTIGSNIGGEWYNSTASAMNDATGAWTQNPEVGNESSSVNFNWGPTFALSPESGGSDLEIDIWHCPSCANTWQQSSCVFDPIANVPLATVAGLGNAAARGAMDQEAGWGGALKGAWNGVKGEVGAGAAILSSGAINIWVAWRVVKGC